MAAPSTDADVEDLPDIHEEEHKLPPHPGPQAKYRKDYRPPPYTVAHVDLKFELGEESTRVHSVMQIKPNYGELPDGTEPPPLVLDGRKDVKLLQVMVADRKLSSGDYRLTQNHLTLSGLPRGEFSIEVLTETQPQANTSLEGLYKSSGNFCTQCEAEGFRGITFFLDRPDVMATYTTRIEADAAAYPVLLSNGNLTDNGTLEDGRHYAVWADPWPKPCYLFALVAGKLAMRERQYTTGSGRSVALRIFVQEQNLVKVDHALDSLVRAMKWDEDTFGLEYDLDLFNIVAVDDFNMGAMENKSLNIFNSRRVLASPTTATDFDYSKAEGVVGHEYFHNWTGNRVTCRDWFQLTLKEGLTRYRDQEFTSDMNSRAVKRIEDVMLLRSSQFPEDAGPLAHPIRPDSYIKMDNFYTLTVYEKGAEVVRMYATLLGKEGFRKGMDLYFKRHDGHAVTCDDFLAAMADANGAQDLAGLAAWYSQAGTPLLRVAVEHDPSGAAGAGSLVLACRQSCAPSAGQGQASKAPVLIPIRMGLLGPDGKALPLRLAPPDGGPPQELGREAVLRLDGAEQRFTFLDVGREPPVPSLLRGFSAPVRLDVEGQSSEQLLFLLEHDTDPFNRWDAGQRLSRQLLLKLYAAVAASTGPLATSCQEGAVADACAGAGGIPESLVEGFRAVLVDESLDGSFKAMAVSLPTDAELLHDLDAAEGGGTQPPLLHAVRAWVLRQLGARLRPELEALVRANDDAPGEPYRYTAAACARRAIKNKALALLAALGEQDINDMLVRRCREATNMTDEIAALSCLAEALGPQRQQALDAFYARHAAEPLVLLKWLTVQASCNLPGNVAAVRALLDHPAFVVTNPNCCYSLFHMGLPKSPVNFHAADGSGYELQADAVLKVDSVNPQVAARLASAFTCWRHVDASRQALMRGQLKRLLAQQGLSENVYEIVAKSLVE